MDLYTPRKKKIRGPGYFLSLLGSLQIQSEWVPRLELSPLQLKHLLGDVFCTVLSKFSHHPYV